MLPMPNRGWYEAVVDLNPATATVRPILGSFGPYAANGMLNAVGDQLWTPLEDRIYRYDYAALDQPREVFRLPDEITRGRMVHRLVTDLTRTADGRYYVLDSWIGNQFHLGVADCQDGSYRELASFGNEHHHAICASMIPTCF